MILNICVLSIFVLLLFILLFLFGLKGKRLFICLLINWLFKLFVVRMFKYLDCCIIIGNVKFVNLLVGI